VSTTALPTVLPGSNFMEVKRTMRNVRLFRNTFFRNRLLTWTVGCQRVRHQSCCSTTASADPWNPVSSEISDFTPCAHAQSDVLHIKYAEKTDD